MTASEPRSVLTFAPVALCHLLSVLCSGLVLLPAFFYANESSLLLSDIGFGVVSTSFAVILTLLAPRFSIALFVLTLPIFGNKPGTWQCIALLQLGAALYFGLLFRVLIEKSSKSALRRPHSVLFLLACFAIASFLSLSSLPVFAILEEILSFAADPRPGTLAASVVLGLRSPENSVAYSVTTAFLVASSVALAQLIGVFFRRDQMPFYAAILAGLLCTLAVGLCDYYGLVSLAPLRSLDPVVNPGGFQFRMQSFFGHSGWFAEFVTLAIPFSLLLLSLRSLRYWQRVTGVIGVLLLGEFCLLLSYQRGGWLSYPFTLLIVWFSIYVFSAFEKGRFMEGGDTPRFSMQKALRASLRKVALSLPLTIIATLAVISVILGESILNTRDGSYTNQYVERFKSMTRASDRLEFVEAGYRLGSLHPFLGGGSESFAFQYEREIVRPTGAFHRDDAHPLHGSAHNLYVQVFAGTGICGLFLLLGALLHFGLNAFRPALYDETISQEQRLLLLSGVCFLFAVLVYGMVQEVFYVHSLRLLVFSVLGVMPFLIPSAFSLGRLQVIAVLCFIFLMSVFHLLWEAPSFVASLRPEFGCYGLERDAESRPYQWCRPKARRLVPLSGEKRDRIRLDIEVPRIDEGKSFDLLRVEIGGELVTEAVVRAGDRWQKELSVPESVLALRRNAEVPVEFFFGSSFVPANDAGKGRPGKDYRLLSFKVYLQNS